MGEKILATCFLIVIFIPLVVSMRFLIKALRFQLTNWNSLRKNESDKVYVLAKLIGTILGLLFGLFLGGTFLFGIIFPEIDIPKAVIWGLGIVLIPYVALFFGVFQGLSDTVGAGVPSSRLFSDFMKMLKEGFGTNKSEKK